VGDVAMQLFPNNMIVRFAIVDAVTVDRFEALARMSLAQPIWSHGSRLHGQKTKSNPNFAARDSINAIMPAAECLDEV
jgi:hypothetical protein